MNAKSIPRALVLVALLAAPSFAVAASLTPQAETALRAALEDEYHAEAVYDATIAKFGNVAPFTNIIRAERQHSSRLVALMRDNGVAVPANPYTSGAKSVGSIPAALGDTCAVGVEAEIANVRLYDEKLLPEVAAYPEIVQVFKALRDASQEKHLPAFQRCASGGQGRGKK